MKLSELVAFRNQLRNLSTMQVRSDTDHQINKIVHSIDSHPLELTDFANRLERQHNDLKMSFNNFEAELASVKNHIENLVSESAQPWFAESYRLYEQEMCFDTAEYILNRRPSIREDVFKLYENRVTRHANWMHPGMIIRPGVEKFIHNMLAFDPLYIVDQSHELLQPAMEVFNESYQRRLRPYVIKESLDQEILLLIPNGQFGFCLVYNFFNFKPLEIIKKYLTEIYQKLKPGGTLIMTFNDCDHWQGVVLAEKHFCCYTPGFLIKDLAVSLGYEIEFAHNNDNDTTWLELRKPGELTSLRGGQTLAKIHTN
jgi:hypothetical protein